MRIIEMLSGPSDGHSFPEAPVGLPLGSHLVRAL